MDVYIAWGRTKASFTKSFSLQSKKGGEHKDINDLVKERRDGKSAVEHMDVI